MISCYCSFSDKCYLEGGRSPQSVPFAAWPPSLSRRSQFAENWSQCISHGRETDLLCGTWPGGAQLPRPPRTQGPATACPQGWTFPPGPHKPARCYTPTGSVPMLLLEKGNTRSDLSNYNCYSCNQKAFITRNHPWVPCSGEKEWPTLEELFIFYLVINITI